MKRLFYFGLILVTLLGISVAQNVGIGIATPTERLHVSGNLRFDGALMPNNNPGTSGQVLTSQGPGVPPIWTTRPINSKCGGAGTLNYLLKWSGPDAVCNSIVYDNGTQVSIGIVPPLATDKFSVQADTTGAIDAIAAYASASGANAVYGQATGAGGAAGLFGITNNGASYGAFAVNTAPNGTALIAYNSAATGTNTGLGIFCYSSQSQGFGLYARNLHTSGTGLIASGNNIVGSYLTAGSGGAFTSNNVGVYGFGNGASADGVYGVANSNTGFGVYGKNSNATGTGISGVGNNQTVTYLASGSGGAFTGTDVGTFGYATSITAGDGVIGNQNNQTGGIWTSPNGSGGSFSGELYGSWAMAVARSSNARGVVGIYDPDPVTNVSYSYDGIGVLGVAQHTNASWGYGVYGQGNWYGVFANGDLGASGAKPFVIDHPLDPENKYLKHFSVESPEVLNLYRGTVTLDANGEAIVTLPDYFPAINRSFTYSLTPIGQPAPNLYIKEEIDLQTRTFKIAGGPPGLKVCWYVYAERNDLYLQKHPEKRQVEVPKKPHEVGKYLMPDLYDQPAEKAIIYIPPARKLEAKTIDTSKYETKTIEFPLPSEKTPRLKE